MSDPYPPIPSIGRPFPTAVAAGIGALVPSELTVGWRTFEPGFGGLATVPALLGGVVVGVPSRRLPLGS